MRLAGLFLLLALASGCRKGTSKAARLVTEHTPKAVATHANVTPAEVQDVTPVAEIVRNLWFVTARVKDDGWRCFLDELGGEAFCDRGEGAILPKLVAFRRLGGNRGSLDDPAWVELVRHAYALAWIFPDKGFPFPPTATPDDWKKKIRVPRVERPKNGGLEMDLDAIDRRGEVVHVRVDVSPDDVVTFKTSPLTP